ncbi:hypothetical protein MUTS15_28010 [Escherichia coli]|nr:hypothetical protein MUTS15_28010 [Escherichia coli]BDZ02743.1 hypothetical protein MUTS16_38160 [Escherichia coli]
MHDWHNYKEGGVPVNKSMLAGIGIGVAAALGVAAVASLNVFERGPQYAQVVSATPIKETVKTPRQECRNVTVTHRRPVQDENRITGSVLGAVAGGVIGHQFGGGRGKDVATVVGALGVDMQVTRSRALSRKAILTRLRNSVVKRCMTSQKKCSVMM